MKLVSYDENFEAPWIGVVSVGSPECIHEGGDVVPEENQSRYDRELRVCALLPSCESSFRGCYSLSSRVAISRW